MQWIFACFQYSLIKGSTQLRRNYKPCSAFSAQYAHVAKPQLPLNSNNSEKKKKKSLDWVPGAEPVIVTQVSQVLNPNTCEIELLFPGQVLLKPWKTLVGRL